MTKALTLTLIDAERHGREPEPAELREAGLPAKERAEAALLAGEPGAEGFAREALRVIADAFLGDREANRDLFERAHQLGRTIAKAAGCWWTPGEESYSVNCPIFALHRNAAHSVAMTTTRECSICGAEPLDCEHLDGHIYGDEICVFKVTAIAPFGHVAWTADPEFTYTWHRPEQLATEWLLSEGVIAASGETAACTHCLNCPGTPSEDDLDPIGRFERLAREHHPQGTGTAA
jgi:hypothetical protein